MTFSGGYYTDSILKFRLKFPPNYPERPPVIQFLTDVFHPLISQQDGTFNLAPRFRQWRYVLSSVDRGGNSSSADRRNTMYSTFYTG